MKKIIFLLFTLLVAAIVRGQGVTLKIYNRTGCELDSVVMGRTYIGHIAKDSVKVIKKMKELTVQGDMPLRLPAGIANGRKTRAFTAECATKSKTVNSGTYSVDLIVKEDANVLRMEWRPHVTEKPKK